MSHIRDVKKLEKLGVRIINLLFEEELNIYEEHAVATALYNTVLHMARIQVTPQEYEIMREVEMIAAQNTAEKILRGSK